MKLVALLSRIATVGVLVAATGLAFNALALVGFAAAASTLVLLIATNDYSHRPGYRAAGIAAQRAEVMPLAA